MKLRKLGKSFLSGVGILWIAGLVANTSGFLYTLLANRALSLAEMGQLGFYTNVMMMVSVASIALGITTNTYVARFLSDTAELKRIASLGKLGILLGIGLSGFALVTYSWWGGFFKFEVDGLVLAGVVLVFAIMLPLSWMRGGLQGEKLFGLVALGLLVEGVVRLGWGVRARSLEAFLVGIPVAAGLSLLVYLVSRRGKGWKQVGQARLRLKKDLGVFWGNAMLQRVGIVMLVTLDVILAKHYLSASQAGVYVLLSLVGKIVFFASQSFYGLITPVVAPLFKNNQKGRLAFGVILGITVLVMLGLTLLMSLFPAQTLGLVLGERYSLITDYIAAYALSSLMFSVIMMVSLYDLLMNRYWLSLILFVPIVLLVVLMGYRHGSLDQVVENVVLVAVVSLCLYGMLWLGGYVKRHSRLSWR